MMMHLSTSQRTAKMTKVTEGLPNDDAFVAEVKKEERKRRRRKKIDKGKFSEKA